MRVIDRDERDRTRKPAGLHDNKLSGLHDNKGGRGTNSDTGKMKGGKEPARFVFFFFDFFTWHILHKGSIIP